ncbi:MAG: [protein-PII] uridylyltransferase, partial [Caulobacterales bacterium]
MRQKPPRIEHVVDGERLRAQLTAAALDNIGDQNATRHRALQLLSGALFRGRIIAQEWLEDGGQGFRAAHLLSAVQDEVIGALWDFTTIHVFRSRNPTKGERLSVIAVGGYGRGELAPSSDIDLLFLRAYKQTAWAESVIEYMLYMLWDMGLKVGHSARNIDECLKLAKDDHTIATSLLDARCLAGDEALFEELVQRYRTNLIPGQEAIYTAAKLKERDDRHLRSGASRYLVEPNVKDGKGGLRDLHTVAWIAKFVYGVRTHEDFVKQDIYTREEIATMERALGFLWTVRCHLHYLTGRSEERLAFDLQPEMARRLGYRDSSTNPGVERFMKRYFEVARDVGRLTRIFAARLEADGEKRPPSGFGRLRVGGQPARAAGPKQVPDAPEFVIDSGRLSVINPMVFRQRPPLMMRLFELGDELDMDIHPWAMTAVTRNLHAAAGMRKDPAAIASFLNVVASERNPSEALHLMNECGLLGKFLPEFGGIVARTQFNMYHHFTVDEHTLRAVGFISDIEHGRREADHPLATKIFPQIVNRRALYLAMLLHDTGKGRGDQQIEGEHQVRSAGARLGLPKEEVDLTAWLVRHHLAMSDTAQKRDLSDPRTVTDFAELVRTPEKLRLLLVLTIADIRAVGEGVWNSW